MEAKPHGERMDRLEQVVQVLAERHIDLEQIIADLAKETRIGFDLVAKQSAETDRRMSETDQRIGKLVGAITELNRAQNPLRPS